MAPASRPPEPPARRRFPRVGRTLLKWVDSAAGDDDEGPDGGGRGVDWLRIVPFLALHLACLAVLWVGVSPIAVAVAAALYLVRMFAVTAFYHRYFSHRSFKTSRIGQFLFAVAGNLSVQRGPLWWAAHHRRHHRFADRPGDAHSPHLQGWLWSHVGWFTARENFRTDLGAVPDLARFPELRFLDRFNVLVPLALLGALYGLGAWLASAAPELRTTGPQMVVWGFCISTVVLLHATFTINSVAHVVGRRRYATRDQSRNNVFLALLTLGEGWHNNHHHYPASTRQGFFWWEIDVTYYLLKLLSRLGIVWDLKPVPVRVRSANLERHAPSSHRDA